ncbi:MAG: hypothetical protein KA795_09595 [Burkholderiaceae bacterium]|nr:hypothetical protein [Burkholderiaceae bacterium]
MYSEQDIDDAVAAGAISAEAARGLRQHTAARQRTQLADEEHFRLVTGFNDIFVVIASVLLLGALYWVAGLVTPWAAPLAVAAASWGLAEYFVRRRRMALPAIVLLASFVLGAGFTAYRLLPERDVAPLVAALAAAVHWWRFRVPITPAAGAGAVVVALLVALSHVDGLADMAWPVVLAAGLAVFAWALYCDASDVRRETRRADVAFWLHLLAAPLLVHPVFTAGGVFEGNLGVLRAVLVLGVFGFLAMVSLAIDRRALMVSGLGYVIYAGSELLSRTASVETSFALAALVIGATLLLLSALWQRARAQVLRRLPVAVTRRLPPPR